MKKGFTIIDLILVLLIIAIISVTIVLPKFVCERKASAMHMRCDWGIIQGCMIEPELGSNKWIPLDIYRTIN